MIENKGLLFILCNINDVKLKTSSIVVPAGLQKYDSTELLTICYYGASYSSKKYFFFTQNFTAGRRPGNIAPNPSILKRVLNM